jgi:hypothetical protein
VSLRTGLLFLLRQDDSTSAALHRDLCCLPRLLRRAEPLPHELLSAAVVSSLSRAIFDGSVDGDEVFDSSWFLAVVAAKVLWKAATLHGAASPRGCSLVRAAVLFAAVAVDVDRRCSALMEQRDSGRDDAATRAKPDGRRGRKKDKHTADGAGAGGGAGAAAAAAVGSGTAANSVSSSALPAPVVGRPDAVSAELRAMKLEFLTTTLYHLQALRLKALRLVWSRALSSGLSRSVVVHHSTLPRTSHCRCLLLSSALLSPALLSSLLLSSPRFSSPLLCSPLLSSPRFSSPLLSSPRFSSPRFSSLLLASPLFSYPLLASPLSALISLHMSLCSGCSALHRVPQRHCTARSAGDAQGLLNLLCATCFMEASGSAVHADATTSACLVVLLDALTSLKALAAIVDAPWRSHRVLYQCVGLPCVTMGQQTAVG